MFEVALNFCFGVSEVLCSIALSDVVQAVLQTPPTVRCSLQTGAESISRAVSLYPDAILPLRLAIHMMSTTHYLSGSLQLDFIDCRKRLARAQQDAELKVAR